MMPMFSAKIPSSVNPGLTPREASVSRPRPIRIAGRTAQVTAAFDTYWRFAFLRQEAFVLRLSGAPPPWTTDAVIAGHRFTNVYRAADRVSQYLIRNVIYAGDQALEEVVFRTLIFKIFNRIDTWERLRDALGEMS